jgi:hypothetical protein
MRDTILGFLGTEYGLVVAGSGIGAILLCLLIALVVNRVRAGRLEASLAASEARTSSLGNDLEIAAKERDAARAKIAEIEKTYSGIIDIDKEIGVRKSTIAELEAQIADLRSSYVAKREVYDRLSHELSVFEDRLDLADIGMFRPVISLGSTAEYKDAIEDIRERQKEMISKKTAIICPTTWTVSGSEAKGRTMINRNIRMTLRAYNNECEVLVNRVSWKNYDSIQSRMLKCRQTYNDLNESLGIVVTEQFERLKLDELRLVYEEAFRHQEEKDRIREEKEREREEAKAQRELQAEIARSEKREREREAALAAARSELAAASEAQRTAYQVRVAELEEQLAKAHEQTERTKSMAEQTRIGHVYIISNIGSFGEEVFKIGMTRRLEPLDRIRELGDASVPFPFEIHALIFTEDAPALERELHAAMEDARVNRVNLRKEFFRASSAHVAQVVRKRFPNVVYVEQPQSQEYLGSMSSRQLEVAIKQEAENRLPLAI